jgi:hypothetical protein
MPLKAKILEFFFLEHAFKKKQNKQMKKKQKRMLNPLLRAYLKRVDML